MKLLYIKIAIKRKSLRSLCVIFRFIFNKKMNLKKIFTLLLGKIIIIKVFWIDKIFINMNIIIW
jgi:hypothetical protein